MRKPLVALLLTTPLLASAANLLTNGSFENGLAGWTSTSGAGTLFPVAVITYGPGAAFGETVPPDNSVSLSPDPVGTKAVYFVDDTAMQTLSQSFTVTTAGFYEVGFSSYAPSNGASNPNDAAFSATIAGNTISSVNVGSLPPATWRNTGGTLSLAAGNYSVNFSFTPTGNPAKDVIVDRVYVVGVPSPIPEPQTYALMLAGLAAVGTVLRRRRS